MSQSTASGLNCTHSEAENQHTTDSATADGGADPSQWEVDGTRAAGIATLVDLGIAPETAVKLLEEFDAIDAVFAAPRGELHAIDGVGAATVEKIVAAEAPITVHVRVGPGGIESIEEEVARDDTEEDTVAEWMERAVHHRLVREFWIPRDEREGEEWGGEQ